MTPKEKADELITKYHTSRDANDWDDVRDVFAARRCALIAVNEILKANPYEVTKTDMDSTIDYWEQVKSEIEKL